MGAIDPIKVKGIRELQAALKDLDGETQKQLRVVFNRIAETVAAGASRRVPVRSGRARASVKVASSQREARIKAGGTRVPYYPWLDFGGQAPGNKTHGARGKRRFVADGRYLYPTYSANRDSIRPALERELIGLARAAGLEVD